MANNNSYTIIDEPKTRFLEHLIINPIFILFAAMIMPLLVDLPYFGRWWLPFVWLLLNGFILGSPTILKESIYSAIGLIIISALFYLAYYLINSGIQFEFSIVSYVVIFMQGIFFLFLYLIVFLQLAPYQIYQYIKDGNNV